MSQKYRIFCKISLMVALKDDWYQFCHVKQTCYQNMLTLLFPFLSKLQPAHLADIWIGIVIHEMQSRTKFVEVRLDVE